MSSKRESKKDMKVLEKPKTETWKLEVHCKCTAKLQINKNDVNYAENPSDGPMRPGGDLYYVNCPCCKEQVYLNEDLLPILVKKEAKGKYKGWQGR